MLYNVLVGFVFAQLHYTTKKAASFLFRDADFYFYFFYSAIVLLVHHGIISSVNFHQYSFDGLFSIIRAIIYCFRLYLTHM